MTLRHRVERGIGLGQLKLPRGSARSELERSRKTALRAVWPSAWKTPRTVAKQLA